MILGATDKSHDNEYMLYSGVDMTKGTVQDIAIVTPAFLVDYYAAKNLLKIIPPQQPFNNVTRCYVTQLSTDYDVTSELLAPLGLYRVLSVVLIVGSTCMLFLSICLMYKLYMNNRQLNKHLMKHRNTPKTVPNNKKGVVTVTPSNKKKKQDHNSAAVKKQHNSATRTKILVLVPDALANVVRIISLVDPFSMFGEVPFLVSRSTFTLPIALAYFSSFALMFYWLDVLMSMKDSLEYKRRQPLLSNKWVQASIFIGLIGLMILDLTVSITSYYGIVDGDGAGVNGYIYAVLAVVLLIFSVYVSVNNKPFEYHLTFENYYLGGQQLK